MDPDEALKNAREAVIVFYESGQQHGGAELAAAFEALDGWLSQGGFLPQDWQKKK